MFREYPHILHLVSCGFSKLFIFSTPFLSFCFHICMLIKKGVGGQRMERTSVLRQININLLLDPIPFLGYLGLYVVYVLTVIVSAYIYNRQKRSRNSVVQDIQEARGKNPKYMHA